MKRCLVKEGDLIHVDWKDSCGNGRWQDKESAYKDAEEPTGMPCQSVGWVLRVTKDALSIHGSRSRYSINDQTSIPRCAVVKIRKLR